MRLFRKDATLRDTLYICLFICLSVCRSVSCWPLTRKQKPYNIHTWGEITQVRAVLRSKVPKSRLQGAEIWKLLRRIFSRKSVSNRVKPQDEDAAHSTLHVSSNLTQQRKCVVFEIRATVFDLSDATYTSLCGCAV